MLHNDAAQQRSGKKPASAPEASQKPPRAQGRANLKILTLKRISSRPGDTTVASLTDGNMDTPHISHIHGRHSPPPRLDPTPHATKSTLQQPHGPAKIMRQKFKFLARLVRYHPFWEGHGGREEEARATTSCMTWHAQQETSSCATIPTDTGRRGHSVSTTSFAAGGVAMRVQYKQSQTAKER